MSPSIAYSLPLSVRVGHLEEKIDRLTAMIDPDGKVLALADVAAIRAAVRELRGSGHSELWNEAINTAANAIDAVAAQPKLGVTVEEIVAELEQRKERRPRRDSREDRDMETRNVTLESVLQWIAARQQAAK